MSLRLLENDEEMKLRKTFSRKEFRQVVEDNRKKVFYHAYDLTGSVQDAEDLAQEVFLKAYRNIEKFKGDASVSSWLYRITLNTFIDQKRKLSEKKERDRDELNELTAARSKEADSHSMSPVKEAETSRAIEDINKALDVLSPRERSVFVMRHFEGMSTRNTGEAINISEGSVKSLLSRAVRKLQKELVIYKDIFNKEVG